MNAKLKYLFCGTFLVLLIVAIVGLVGVGNATDAVAENGTNNYENGSYTLYSSGNSGFTEENGTLVSTASGEQKAIYSEEIGHSFDVSFTISVADNASAINGGLYFWASSAANSQYGIDAYNIQVVREANSPYYRVFLYEFTNNGAIGKSHSDTSNIGFTGNEISVRVIIYDSNGNHDNSENVRLNVYINGSNVPCITKKLYRLPRWSNMGVQVGFRSMTAAQTFSDISFNEFTEFPTVPTVKVLMIGNSFAEDTMTYTHEIAAAAGINMVCGVMYCGNCTLKQHAEYMKDQNTNYWRYTYFKNGGTDLRDARFDFILQDEEWDYITFQSGDGESGLYDTYFPYIHELVSYVEKKCPSAEIGIFQSWAMPKYMKNYSTADSAGRGFLAKYDDDCDKMYNDYITTIKRVVEENGLGFVVPSCEAFYRLEEKGIVGNTSIADSFHRDTVGHLDDKGMYFSGAVVYATITGNKLEGNTFIPGGNKPVYNASQGYPAGDAIGEETKKACWALIDELVGSQEYPALNACKQDTSNEIVSLKVSGARTDYRVGEFFDCSTLVVNAVYSDGSMVEVKYYTIDKMTRLTATDTVITVTYRGKSVQIEINVC